MRVYPFVVSATALIAATYGLARFGYGLFVPAFSASFDLTPALTGIISSGSFASYCLTAAVAYRLAAAPRLLTALAGGVAAGGSVGVAVSGSAAGLAIGMLIAGAGAGFASPGLVGLVQERAGSDSARMQAVVNSGTGFGVVVAGPLALLLAEQWRAAWFIIAILNIAATLAVLAVSKQTRTTTTTTAAAAPRRTFRLGELKPLRAASVAALLAGVSSAALWIFGRSLVTTEGGLGEFEATVYWICLGAAGVAGAFSGDLVIRWGLRRAWAATALLMGLATLVVGVAPSVPVTVYAGGAVFGASYVALSGVLIVWSTKVLPDQAAAGTAALFIALALGQAAGAVLIGSLLEISNPTAAFVAAAAVAGASLVPAARRAALAGQDSAPALATDLAL